jgi:hypothetical protein
MVLRNVGLDMLAGPPRRSGGKPNVCDTVGEDAADPEPLGIDSARRSREELGVRWTSRMCDTEGESARRLLYG